MKRGNSVCFLKADRQVIDTTMQSEFKLRVTGAINVRKGKIKLIPWSKQIEKEYEGETGIVLASGPLMLKDGQICDWNSCGTNFIRTKHPRSAVATTKEGKILLITVDGRFPEQAEGVNIPELAHLIRILGGEDALNLDGGGSTTLGCPVHRMMESLIILVIMGGLIMLGSVRCLIFFIFINTTL